MSGRHLADEGVRLPGYEVEEADGHVYVWMT